MQHPGSRITVENISKNAMHLTAFFARKYWTKAIIYFKSTDYILPLVPINTMTAWRPVLRPISAIVIAAQLALVLQPLSVMAQHKGQQSISPLAQNQLNRINLMSRDIEAALAKKQLDSASPADKASADLARIEEISKTLHADLRARGLATLPAKPTSTGQASDKDAKDIRAIGPNMRIETQRNPQQDAALRLQDSQRSQQLADLKDLLSRQTKPKGPPEPTSPPPA